MGDRSDRMFAENARLQEAAFNTDWSGLAEASHRLSMAVQRMGHSLYLHMHPEIEQQRQYRRKQQQLRTHVNRQCAGVRRRQRTK